MEELEELYNNLSVLRSQGQPTYYIEARIRELEREWIEGEFRPCRG